MARLPQVGGDDGNWGEILNDYLAAAHNADGTLKTGSVTTDVLANNVTLAQSNIANLTTDLAAKASLVHTHPTIQARNGIAFIGDSYTVGAGSAARFTRQAVALLGGAVKHLGDFGVSGQRTDQIAARWETDITPLVSQGLGYVVLCTGMNDALQSTPYATTTAALTTIANCAKAQGITLIITTVPPHASGGTATRCQVLSSWIQLHAHDLGYLVADLYELANPATGAMATALNYDDIHVNTSGHNAIARAISTVLKPIIAPGRGMLANTNSQPGTVRSNTFTQLFSGWPANWDSGYTTISSGITRSSVAVEGWQGSAWRTSFAGVTGAATEKCWTGSNSLTPGDWVEVWMRLRISNASNIAEGDGLTIKIQWVGGSEGYYMSNLRNNGDYILRQRWQIPTGVTSADVILYHNFNNSTVTIDKGEFAVYTGAALSAAGVPS